MNYPGTDLKFKVTADIAGFDLSSDPFAIIIKNNFRQIVRRIPRAECFFDSDRHCYFVFEHPHRGVYTAFFIANVADDDYAKQASQVTDVQMLTSVGYEYQADNSSVHQVEYEQVYVRSVDDADYLADADGNYILTSDGKRIQFNVTNPTENMGKTQLSMSGPAFKHLIEGRSQDGTVNTVPEIMDVMVGIGDDNTVKHQIDTETEPKMDGVTQEQFDAIFKS